MLDLSNAFGSIPTELILAVLQKAGVGNTLCKIIRDIMTDGTTAIASEERLTSNLPVQCGVRQGYPLSCILLNFEIEPLIRSLLAHESEFESNIQHHCLAYADDL